MSGLHAILALRHKWGIAAGVMAVVVLASAAPGSSAPPAKATLVFTTSAKTLTAGSTSSAITVQLQGAAGPASVSLSTTSPGGRFRDPTNSTDVTSVTIVSGQTSASFLYVDTVAGGPTITATAKSLGGQFNGKASASQTETVQAGPLDHLGLAPATASVKVGVSQTYSATGLDQYGNTLGTVTSSTTFTIAPNGSCTGSSCKANVPGPHTVTGSYAGKTGTATLNVTQPGLDHIVVSPTYSGVSLGTGVSYTVQAQDVNNASLGDVTSLATFSIAPSGSCTANTCTATQPGWHTVTATYGTKTATASQAVTSSCQTSGPTGGSYTVTVCLSPTGGSVSGLQPISASVSVNGPDPHTGKLIFSLDGQYLLTDYQSPYTFLLPTTRWVDGPHTLEVAANERDGFVAQPAAVTLTFANGVTQPPGMQNGFTPTPGTTPGAGQPYVLAAVGDGAGGELGAGSVSDLIAGWNPNLFLYLGDVYEKGTPTEFLNWYGQAGGSFFGRFRSITDPTIGNHEYEKGQAPGYFDYWNNPPDYYSVNTPVGWHLISLNSNLDGAVGSPQYSWLSQDLQADTQPCTLVYFHHPLFNIGPEPVPARFADVWPLLAQHGVDVVLNGHDHDYQRWTSLDGNGNPDPAGVTEFVVGTGGHSLQSFVTMDPRVADSASGSFGAMRLDLSPGGASYRYVTGAGVTLDSGSITCDPSGVDTQAPSVPQNVGATTVAQTTISPGIVNLTWDASTDNVGVNGYNVYRDGQLIATVGTQTEYADQGTTPETTYAYRVSALDAAGNESALSAPLSVTTPPVAPIFSDGFESGDLSHWTTVAGLGAEQADAYTGTWSAEGVATSTEVAYAWETLPSDLTSVYYRVRFKIVSLSGTSVYLERFRTNAGAASILGAYVSSTGKLGLRNDVVGASTTSSTVVTLGQWHTLQVHVTIADTSGAVETWLDGTQVAALTGTQSLGTAPVGRIQLCENATGKSYDVFFDDVAVDTVPLP